MCTGSTVARFAEPVRLTVVRIDILRRNLTQLKDEDHISTVDIWVQVPEEEEVQHKEYFDFESCLVAILS